MVKPIYPDFLCRYVTFAQNQQPPIQSKQKNMGSYSVSAPSPKIRCYSRLGKWFLENRLGKWILEKSEKIRSWTGIQNAKTDLWTYRTDNKSVIYIKASDAKAFWEAQHSDEAPCPETSEAWQQWLDRWAVIEATQNVFHGTIPTASQQNLSAGSAVAPDDTVLSQPELSAEFDRFLDEMASQETDKTYVSFGAGNWWLDAYLMDYVRLLSVQNEKLFPLPIMDNGVPRGTYVLKSQKDGQTSVSEAILKDGFSDTSSSKATIFAYPLWVSGNHFTLVLVDKETRTIEYFDSLYPHGNYEEIVQNLENLTHILTKKDSGRPYQFKAQMKIRVQENTSDCGSWVNYFLENRLQNPSVNFNTLDPKKSLKMIADYRKGVVKALSQERHREIIKKGLRDRVVNLRQEIAKKQQKYPNDTRQQIIQRINPQENLRGLLEYFKLDEEVYLKKLLEEVLREDPL